MLIKNGKKETEKSKKSIILLKSTLKRQVLFMGLGDKMIDKMIDKMYKIECPKNKCIIKQIEVGDAYFVVESGKFIIIRHGNDKKKKVIGTYGPKSAFGEGSLLYSTQEKLHCKQKKTQLYGLWMLKISKNKTKIGQKNQKM